MKPKSFLMLMVAAGGALVASFGVTQMNQGETTKTTKILVAKVDIEPYLPLTEEVVAFKEFPVELVPLGAVKTKAEYERRALRTKGFAGQPIVKANLGEKGDFDASTEIPEGYRVYTSPITQTSSHSGQIRPKDRVDIFVTYKDKDGASRVDRLKTKMILEFIEVFSMGGDRDNNSPAKNDMVAKNVSLLVTPKQAAILMMAESKGDLHFALRPKNETAAAEVELLTEEDFDNLGTAQSIREELEEELQGNLEELRTQMSAEHAKELEKLKMENQRLLAALQSKPQGTPAPKVVETVEPEVWKIKVVNGSGTEESEFVLGEDGKEAKPANKAEGNSTEEKQETSSLPAKGSKNPMQSILNRFFEGG